MPSYPLHLLLFHHFASACLSYPCISLTFLHLIFIYYFIYSIFSINVLLHLFFMNTLFVSLVLILVTVTEAKQPYLATQWTFGVLIILSHIFFIFLSNLIRFYFTNKQNLYLTGFGFCSDSLMKFPSHMHWNLKLISMFREVRTKCPNRSAWTINWF